MAKLNHTNYTDPSEFTHLPPGIYAVEVKAAEEKVGKTSGNAYFQVQFTTGGQFLCFDTLMLEGNGLNMGLAKLYALGIPSDCEEILAAELIGRTCWVSTKVDTFRDQEKLVVDIGAKDSKVGYFTEKPAGVIEAAADGGAEDTPF